jgi:hypothetical protein
MGIWDRGKMAGKKIIVFGKEITHEAGKSGWKRTLEVPSFVRQSPPPTLKLGQHKSMVGS